MCEPDYCTNCRCLQCSHCKAITAFEHMCDEGCNKLVDLEHSLMKNDKLIYIRYKCDDCIEMEFTPSIDIPMTNLNFIYTNNDEIDKDLTEYDESDDETDLEQEPEFYD